MSSIQQLGDTCDGFLAAQAMIRCHIPSRKGNHVKNPCLQLTILTELEDAQAELDDFLKSG